MQELKIFTTEGLLLKALCRNPERKFPISELAEELRIDKSLVSRIVQKLEKEDIIRTEPFRNLKLCYINKDHSTYKSLLVEFNRK